MKNLRARIVALAASLFLFYSLLSGQIVINEVVLNTRFVEVKNLGNADVDIAQYYLVNGTNSVRIGMNFPLCGGGNSFVLEPGEVFINDGLPMISWESGEVALYKNNLITDPANLLDYVEWGSSGHDHEPAAVSMGQWQLGTFVPAILNGGSLEYDGEGDTASDWVNSALSTTCNENGAPCTVSIQNVMPNENPFQVCAGLGFPDNFNYTFTNNSAQTLRSVILDSNDRIVAFSNAGDFSIDLNSLMPADTAGLTAELLGYRGPIGYLEPGRHIDSLIGCYFHEGKTAVSVRLISDGNLTLTYQDSIITDTLEICTTDGIPDIITLESDAPVGNVAYVLYDYVEDTAVAISLDVFEMDLDGITIPYLGVISSTYDGEFVGAIGDLTFQIGGECSTQSYNSAVINTGVCISATHSVPNQSDLSVRPNPAHAWLDVFDAPADAEYLTLTSITGQCMIHRTLAKGEASVRLNIEMLPTGIYLVRITGKSENARAVFVKN